jgi:hypothetical protein
MLSYTWWNQSLSYHALVRLANKTKEGLLIDSGAVGNIAGPTWDLEGGRNTTWNVWTWTVNKCNW